MPGRVQSHTDACSEPQREQAAEEGGRRQADSAALSGKGTTAGEAGLVPVVAKPTLEPPRFHLPETRPRAGVPALVSPTGGPQTARNTAITWDVCKT